MKQIGGGGGIIEGYNVFDTSIMYFDAPFHRQRGIKCYPCFLSSFRFCVLNIVSLEQLKAESYCLMYQV